MRGYHGEVTLRIRRGERLNPGTFATTAPIPIPGLWQQYCPQKVVDFMRPARVGGSERERAMQIEHLRPTPSLDAPEGSRERRTAMGTMARLSVNVGLNSGQSVKLGPRERIFRVDSIRSSFKVASLPPPRTRS